MSDSKNPSTKDHNITLASREKLSINGIREIINFDESCVNVKTVCGELSIEGEDIHISVLNIEKGELEMQGKISGLNYFDKDYGERRSLLSRIFK